MGFRTGPDETGRAKVALGLSKKGLGSIKLSLVYLIREDASESLVSVIILEVVWLGFDY